MNEQKNLIWAMILSAIVVLLYFTFVEGPMQQRARLDAEAEVARVTAQQPSETSTLVIEDPKSREELIAQGEATRIEIDTPVLKGSFLTTGSRVDDLSLKEYNATLDPEDGLVQLLNPAGGDREAYIADNWTAVDGGSGTSSAWTVLSGDKITPSSPVVLQKQVGDVRIQRELSVDDSYLITLTDTLTNTGSTEANVERKGVARQVGLSDDLTNFFIIQEGPISVIDGKYHEQKYKKLRKQGGWTITGEGGWVGLTDKYWLQAAIAPQGRTVQAEYDFKLINDKDVYETSYTTSALTLTPGATITSVGHMMAAPKDYKMLNAYEEAGIGDLTNAIGWGKMKILVKPITRSLSWLGEKLGSLGFGILALTLLIKLLMYPLYSKQYASQAKMKKVQPMLKKLQVRYKDDRMKLQQEMMALYKREGANPAAGCLPIIPTIFVFFALYKAVFINIDLRHESFLGYIQDLSARDPLSIINGFGLFPWSGMPDFIPALLTIGPLAILYGASMSLMYTLTPTPSMGAGDQAAMMAKMMKWMPWMFMFILAGFPAGLLLYWIWNNILSFAQQYWITRKNGVDTPVDQFFRKLTGRPEPIVEGEAVEVEPNSVKKTPKKPKK
ncbi:membrane protein insertase YidC [Litorimonas cladophorae]|uniref:Membrane protein insertase YidC n=1 Tax=Litorimonas cladophorae TaxID=1220491 RepID=A0A918NJZ5_9PROT|nr:membrane protein insertase YidC [Litorimonas cladophorae]GGX73331.1 membrane protein insertase YidC [Litorimonas cladophorae]